MRMSKPAKSAFWFVLCTLIQKALAFITVPIFTRIMPAEQYGIYNLYQTWSGILVVICTRIWRQEHLSMGLLNQVMRQ